MTLYDKFRIPDRFTVGGQDYEVVKKDIARDKDGDALFGLHSPTQAKIFISEKYELNEDELGDLTKYQKVNSFFHEMFHAFNFMMNTEQDETIAQSFANFACEFLKTAEYDT